MFDDNAIATEQLIGGLSIPAHRAIDARRQFESEVEMFDEVKIQSLADELREIVCEHIGMGLRYDKPSVDIADDALADIIKRLYAVMLKDRNMCLALMERLSQEFEGEASHIETNTRAKDCICNDTWHGVCMNCGASTQ